MSTDPMLSNKHIVLGVTGSIACYKAAELASALTQAGAQVDVVLTREATEFITPLTFRSLTHRPVVTDLFDPDSELAVEHVALAERADIVVVAPATANVIAKMANGLADDALTCTALATRAPLLLAPAMDARMWENPATQENVAKLKTRGAAFVGPESGRLASGLVGIGRLATTDKVLGAIRTVLGRRGDLAGKRVLVTAGGTVEPLDPVRVITNRSSGKMGYAMAEAARDRGADVVLITTLTSLPDPYGVTVRRVETAVQMRDAVMEEAKRAHALIMAAAVADYMPEKAAPQKIKKAGPTLELRLVRTPDILSAVQGDLVKVGFAAEDERLLENAREKLVQKGLHLIVANDITRQDSGFGTDTNKVSLIDKDGRVEELPLLTKNEVAHKVLDRVAKFLAARRP